MKHLQILLFSLGVLAVGLGCAKDTTTIVETPSTPADPGSLSAQAPGGSPGSETPAAPTEATQPEAPGAPAPSKPVTESPAATARPATPSGSTPAPPAGSYLLRVKPKKGESFRYQMSMKAEGASGPAAMGEMDATVRMSVSDVSAGETTIRMTFEKLDVPMFAQLPPEQRQQVETMFKSLAIIYTLDERGNSKSIKSEGGMPGMERAFDGMGGATAAFPEKPVKVGDSYTTEQTMNGNTVKSTYKIVGVETKHGVRSLKMNVSVDSGKDAQTLVMWVDPSNGMMVALQGTSPVPAGPGGQGGGGTMKMTMRKL